MKNQSKKLAAYSTLAVTFIAVGSEADAQIIYTDIEPDVVLTENGDLLGVNLNSNGVNDILLKKNNLAFSYVYDYGGLDYNIYYGFNFIRVSPGADNSIMATYGLYYYPYPFALNNGDPIDGSQNWIQYSSNFMNRGIKFTVSTESGFSYGATYSTGYWQNGIEDKYLGVRVNINKDSHFGWVRMSVSDDGTSLIVKDYAINFTKNTGLLAGQMETADAIQNLHEGDISAYSFSNIIHIIMNDVQPDNFTAKVFNTSGQIIYETKLTENNTKIELHTAPGIYTLLIIGEEGMLSKQLHIQ